MSEHAESLDGIAEPTDEQDGSVDLSVVSDVEEFVRWIDQARAIADIPFLGRIATHERTLRYAANGLSIGRGVAGLPIAGYLAVVPPEKRSWTAATATGLILATDFIDGDISDVNKALNKERYTDEERAALAGLLSYRIGPFLDQAADKALLWPPMIALALRGEIAPSRPLIKIARDIGVMGVKHATSQLDGESYPSAAQLGRIKMLAESGALVIAASPLSAMRGPDGETTLTEHAFRAAQYISLVSGAQYVAELKRALGKVDVHDIKELVVNGPKIFSPTKRIKTELTDAL